MVPPENKGNVIPPILTIPHLKQYVNAEWEIFKSIISKLIKDRVDEARLNPFAQFIHDAVTLKNKKKIRSFRNAIYGFKISMQSRVGVIVSTSKNNSKSCCC